MKKVIIAEPVLRAIENSNTMIGRGGITIYPACTSEEVYALHQMSKADLIVTEFSLPVMDGARLCSAIRSDAALRDVSVVIVCDAAGPAPSLCRQAGANAVLTNPVQPSEIFSRISELLVIPQRQAMRVFLHVSVLERTETRSFPGMSHNISISGMLLEAEEEMEEGERLVCTLDIGGREVSATCEVVRVERTAARRFRYGVKFLRLDTKTLIIIEQYVKGKIKH